MATRPSGRDTDLEPASIPSIPSISSIPALTISQPYAEAVLTGRKTIETRTWATAHRGWLAVHAGGAWWRERTLGKKAAQREAEVIARRLGLALPVAAYPRRALVGVVRVVDCFPFDAATWEALRPQHGVAEPWRPHLVGWHLADPRPLPAPVSWPGALGLFRVPLAALGFSDNVPLDSTADGT